MHFALKAQLTADTFWGIEGMKSFWPEPCPFIPFQVKPVPRRSPTGSSCDDASEHAAMTGVAFNCHFRLFGAQAREENKANPIGRPVAKFGTLISKELLTDQTIVVDEQNAPAEAVT